MSRAQIVAVILTAVLCALDGYDVLSITFAAPGITRDWQVGKAALGLVFSSGLVGMAIGSLMLAPFADVIGRRRMLLVCLVIMAVGMLFSAFSNSVTELGAWRVITGVGIGAMIAIINPLAVEFANARRRALAVSIMTIGYPIGGALGGFAAAALLRTMDWPAVFLLGAALAALLFPFVLWLLPEPLTFLLERRDERSLARVNSLLVRCGHRPIDALPPPLVKSTGAPYKLIFAPIQRFATLQITAVNFLFVMTVYYFWSWLPQMVADAGFDASTGAAISAIASLAGVFGAIALGLLASYYSLRNLVVVSTLGLGLATAAFGFMPNSLILLATMAAVTGGFLVAGTAGLFTTIANTFEPHMRATGTGFVIGIGRGGSALAPAVAGLLFAFGAERAEVSTALGACAVLAGLVLIMSRKP